MRLTELIREVELQVKQPDHHKFLEHILIILGEIKDDIDADPETRKGHARALGYFLLDDLELADSHIGTRLLTLRDQYKRGELKL